MIQELGVVIAYIEQTGNIWFVIAAILFGVLMRELKEHKDYTLKVNETMVSKEVYDKSFEYAAAVSEHYKEIVQMIDKLSGMLAIMTENNLRIQGEHTAALAKILTILTERLPRGHD